MWTFALQCEQIPRKDYATEESFQCEVDQNR